ncbi:MAG: MATE family efflux transporter [Planctomycetota bacterium]|nr:MAG: MATE family efflux transporter [Planctomycetota bacterium]
MHGRPPHPFRERPHRTLLRLALPVLVSLVAEPVAALVDTAFVKELGAAPLAAVGVGTTLLSGVFWVFNFLGVASQSEVAAAAGAGDRARGREAVGLALGVGLAAGVVLLAIGWAVAGPAAAAMAATGEVRADAVLYLRIRLLAAPAVLSTLVAFGALRGLEDMQAPLRVAVGLNAWNVVLDRVLIFGIGPVPAFGLAGAAWATVASQWLGAAAALLLLYRRLGPPARAPLRRARRLVRIGGDLFVRTGLLTLFLVLGTREATAIGPEAGAAHHAIRAVWLFAALVLDAFALSSQSLVAFFLGAGDAAAARRVARICCGWSLAAGCGLGLGMLVGRSALAALLVPAAARAAFAAAWLPAALAQPLNALSFATDGLHWGAQDYRWLRNAMVAAFLVGWAGLAAVDRSAEGALAGVWWATSAWILVRSALGLVRIWPGVGASPWWPRRAG